jgi:hypothetical protein
MGITQNDHVNFIENSILQSGSIFYLIVFVVQGYEKHKNWFWLAASTRSDWTIFVFWKTVTRAVYFDMFENFTMT